MPLSFKEKMLLKTVLKNVERTDLELLLRDTGLIDQQAGDPACFYMVLNKKNVSH